MRKEVVTCDVCKKECECVRVFLQYNYHHTRGKNFDVCAECCINAGLFERDVEYFQYNTPPTTAESLFNLLEQIAREAVQND